MSTVQNDKPLAWRKYGKDRSDSGILKYAIGQDFIVIAFKRSPDPYLYTHTAIGKDNVEEMKKLATEGRGLNSFINQHKNVKDSAIPYLFRES